MVDEDAKRQHREQQHMFSPPRPTQVLISTPHVQNVLPNPVTAKPGITSDRREWAGRKTTSWCDYRFTVHKCRERSSGRTARHPHRSSSSTMDIHNDTNTRP